MKIRILQLIEGAKAARGLTVIIDVFRAFTAEAYLIRSGARYVIPVADVQTALEFKKRHPDTVLCGERGGAKIEGFDFGNSPSEIENADLRGKTVIHTTSAGTQGVENARAADEIIGGSLVCAKAIAEYIKQKNPKEVSLVCMGLAGKRPTEEDTLAAEYIKSILEDSPLPDINERTERLKEGDGAKFFDRKMSEIFPTRDFELCTRVNLFPFVLRLKEGGPEGMRYMERVDALDTLRGIPEGPVTRIREDAFISEYSAEEVARLPDEIKGRIAYGNYREPEGAFDAALVLGCRVEHLKCRAEAAAALYRDNKCSLFITTGGVCRDTPYGFITEAEALRRYMTDAGVPGELIVAEERAATTHENMTYSRAIIAEKCKKPHPRVAIVTSYYHLRRAVELAKIHVKEADVFGIRARAVGDCPEGFPGDPILAEAVTKECCCLYSYAKSRLIPDFKIL